MSSFRTLWYERTFWVGPSRLANRCGKASLNVLSLGSYRVDRGTAGAAGSPLDLEEDFHQFGGHRDESFLVVFGRNDVQQGHDGVGGGSDVVAQGQLSQFQQLLESDDVSFRSLLLPPTTGTKGSYAQRAS